MTESNEKANIEQEFEDIENKKLWKIVLMSIREESDKHMKNETFDAARNAINRTRNRYRDVLPYDSTRVKIPELSSSDYINASYVNLMNNKYNRRYILTQGPVPSTISHFWKMVWNENTNCIIMLNKIIEKETIKCAPYFPATEQENNKHNYPEIDLSISLVETQSLKAYIKRIFILTNEKTKEERRIIQFHYQSWPDFGVPSCSEQFLQFLWDIRANGGLEDPNRPAVVHCSAGIGRSGTFVLIDLALLQIAEERSCKSLNLQEMLIQLRQCRIGLIQSAEQLRFAYASILSGAKALLSAENIDDNLIKFDELDLPIVVPELVEDSSSSEEETDSDFSELSDNSNSALDKAAAAVRTRRGLPATNDLENSIIIPQNNYNRDTVDYSKSECQPFQASTLSAMEQDRKIIRETRLNRTRQMIDDIRSNMRQQDLERERIIFRLGLSRFANVFTRQNRNSVIAGASVIVGVASVACGYFLYKYVG